MYNVKYSSCIDEHIMISHDWEFTMHLKWPEHVYKSLCYPNVRGARDPLIFASRGSLKGSRTSKWPKPLICCSSLGYLAV